MALEERLSYGGPSVWWDCTCNDKNKTRKTRILGKQEEFSTELFSFHQSSRSAHFNSWGTSLPLVEADSGPYISRLNLVPSIICPCLEQEEIISKSTAKMSMILISNFGKHRGLVDGGEVLSTSLGQAVSAADDLLAPTSCCVSSINTSDHHLWGMNPALYQPC